MSASQTHPLMSEEQLKAFLELVKADTSLQEKLKAAANPDAVVAIAKEAGFSISADDIKMAQPIELSEEELEGVAGGYYVETEGTNGGACGTICPNKAHCKGGITHQHRSC